MTQRGPFLPLTEAQLRALPTHRLLAYQGRTRRVHEGSWDDPDRDDVRKSMKSAGWIQYKDEPAYAEHQALVKSILSEREHVSR